MSPPSTAPRRSGVGLSIASALLNVVLLIAGLAACAVASISASEEGSILVNLSWLLPLVGGCGAAIGVYLGAARRALPSLQAAGICGAATLGGVVCGAVVQ